MGLDFENLYGRNTIGNTEWMDLCLSDSLFYRKNRHLYPLTLVELNS